MVKRPMEPSARSARDLSRFLRDFIGLDDPDNRGTGDMVQQSATEVNSKLLGTFAGGFQGAKGGDGGERADGSQSEGEGSEGEEDRKAPQNPFR